jgi:uncharacterized protein Yka (UPF0111/DUF47 family)
MKKAEKGASLQAMFEENGTQTKLILKRTADALIDFSGEHSDEMKDNCEEVIKIEKLQDRLRERIIAQLFVKETMVFSKPDRLFIVNELDNVSDACEMVAQELMLHSPKPIPEILEDIRTMADQMLVIGELMEELITNIFINFNKAKETIINIQDTRRSLRDSHWGSTKKLYCAKPDYIDFAFYKNLLKLIAHVADISENLSDNVYSLVCKYTL